MLREIRNQIEKDFDFSEFQYLSQTGDWIEKQRGKILYIPTNKPVPFNKTVLNNIIHNRENVLILPIAKTKEDLRENIYLGIEHLLDYGGKASVVFFCMSSIIDEYNSIPGANFVKFEKLEIKDRIKTLTTIFKSTTSISPKDHNFSGLGNFVFRVYISFVTREDTHPKFIKYAPKNEDYLYIPFRKLNSIPNQLKIFYLKTIGISYPKLFLDYEKEVQKNIFAILFKKKYGFLNLKEEKNFLKKMKKIDDEILKLFRRLAIEKAIKGRLFDLTMKDVADRELDRNFINSIQKSYRILFENNKKINFQEPEEASKIFLQNFALLFSEIKDNELDTYLSNARSQFSQDKLHIKDYNSTQAMKTIKKLNNFLKLLIQISLMKSFALVNRMMDDEKWKNIFLKFLKKKENIGENKFLTYTNFKVLNQAKQIIEQEKQMSKKAERIHNQKVSLSKLASFLKEWCSFVLDESETKNPNLRSIFVEKYDEFTSKLFESYNNDELGKKYLHISELLEPTEKDELRVFLIIDGFGYTDYQIIKQTGFLDSEPVKTDLMFSNIPSYTPSAIATLLTGLKPETTGIYHWQTKKKENIFHLKKFYLEDSDFEFIDVKTNYSYNLLQNKSNHESGITLFAEKICNNIRKNNLNIGPGEKNNLESLREKVLKNVEGWLHERERILTDPNKPKEAKKALETDLVIYLEKFDRYLHSEISKEEFENYYRALANFIDFSVSEILDLEKEYNENLEIIIGADHGKLTRKEKDIIQMEKNYEFNPNMLKDNVKLKEAYVANFNEATFTEREGKIDICLASTEKEEVISKVRSIIDENIDASDEEIMDIMEKQPLILSSQKFQFGWYENLSKEKKRILRETPGIDTFFAKESKIFDRPTVGILSRYDTKQNYQYTHGFHGGTSLSEMTTVKMTFRGEDNAKKHT